MKLKEITKRLCEGREEFLATGPSGQSITKAAMNDLIANKIAHDPLKVVREIRKIDPTPTGKMLNYLVSQYIKQQYRLEDGERVNKALKMFDKLKSSLPNKDINQFKSIRDLQDMVRPYYGKEDDIGLTQKQQQQRDIEKGSKVIAQSPGMEIRHIHTPEAAKALAHGTDWCTKDETTFLSYAKRGDIIAIILPKDKRKFQFHYYTGQLMDEHDQPVAENSKDIELLSQYDAWYDFIKQLQELHHHEV